MMQPGSWNIKANPAQYWKIAPKMPLTAALTGQALAAAVIAPNTGIGESLAVGHWLFRHEVLAAFDKVRLGHDANGALFAGNEPGCGVIRRLAAAQDDMDLLQVQYRCRVSKYNRLYDQQVIAHCASFDLFETGHRASML